MARNLSGIHPLAYMGVEPTSPPLLVIYSVAPSIYNTDFNVGTIWINDVTEGIYMLTDLEKGIATWTNISSEETWNADTDSCTSVAHVMNVNGSGILNTTGATDTLTVGITNGTAGQVIIAGATTPAWGKIDSSGGTVAVTYPDATTINLEVGGASASSFLADDAGTATPAAGVLTVTGGTNISTTGATSILTINIDANPTFTSVLATTFDTNVAAAGVTLVGATLAADGTDADIDINITAKGAGQVIIDDLQLTTDLAVSEGGTGVSTLTDHGIMLGQGATDVITTAVGVTGEMLIGNTGADPSWSATGSLTNLNVTTVTATTINGTTFDTNIAAAGVTLSGTSLLADGTDADIDINITAKGAGQVIIDDLQLTTDLAVEYGGTGAGTFTDGGLLVGAAASPIEALAVGGVGTILTGVAGANPTWTTATYPATAAIGTILVTSGANVITTLAPDTAGYVLTDGGAGVAPSWSSPATAGTVTSVSGGTNISASGTAADPVMDLDAAITLTTVNAITFDTNVAAAGVTLAGTSLLADGTDTDISINITSKGTGQVIINDLQLTADLAVTEGGTGASTLLDHGVLVGSGTAAVEGLTVGVNGYLLVGATGADPAFAELTSTGGTIAVTGGANTLNIESNPGVLWSESTGTTQAMSIGNGYIANNVAPVVFTLPATAAVGNVIRVSGLGTGGWKIEQNASQEITFLSQTTTNGVTGYLESTNDNDTVELLCTVTNTTFNVISAVGNITFV